jgi:hypothetical protein
MFDLSFFERPLISLDVESVGLHGRGFAAAYVVVDPLQGWKELEAAIFATRATPEMGTPGNLEWVQKNVMLGALEVHQVFNTPAEVCEAFWVAWRRWKKEREAALLADHPWPVEGHFLNACVDAQFPAREWEGPYPLLDITTACILADVRRLERTGLELPEHNPLADARHSVRRLRYAMVRLGGPLAKIAGL